MKSNAKSTQSTARKPASSSSRSRNAALVSKSDLSSHSEPNTDELDGVIDRNEVSAVESETGDRVLAETGIDSGEPRIAVLKPELKNETGFVSEGEKVAAKSVAAKPTISQSPEYAFGFEIGDRVDTQYGQGFVDKILPDRREVHVRRDSGGFTCYKFNQAAGEISRLPCDAFGNVKGNPLQTDCGEVQHAVEADGQLNLLEWDSNEPPEPDDFPGDLEGFKAAYLNWSNCLEGTTEEEYQHIDAEEIWNQSGAGIGLIYAAESVPVSLSPESNAGDAAPIHSLNGTSSAPTAFSREDSLMPEDLATSKAWILGETTLKNPSISLPPVLPANPSQLMENDLQPTTIETVSPPSSPRSDNCNPTLQLLKMLPDYSIAHSEPEAANSISLESLSIYPTAGTMQNGNVSPQPILGRPGVEKDYLLLRSPGALSTTKGRPPGQSRLEVQLQQLWLIQEGEVVAPEFLELGYSLPTGWTNPEENRTAIELSQVQTQQLPTVPSSELPLVMESTAIVELPSETHSIGELQPLLSNELNILPDLGNLGSFNKDELLSIAREQHGFILSIERKEFDLGIEKLQRACATGICLQEFKRRCKYGEFENQLEAAGISVRSSQNYMAIAKNWDIVEAKTKLVSLLTEESQENLPAIGLKWALEAIRDEKKQLKSAEPPADPDSWRTPNTRDQPIVQLVTEALGGEIWCDPCSDPGHHIPARVHYNSSDSGLNARNLWTRTVFINPPFSNPLEWVDKCCDSIARGDCSQAIMLLKAGTLSNQGTGELINKFASGICHWRGRINFLNDNGIAVKGSDFDCVLVYFGDRFDRFQETFETFGTVSFIENHYSSVNKRPVPAVKSIAEESRELAAAVGLSNGKSVLPDLRDSDRELMERCDPNTCDDRPLTSNPTTTVEMTRSESLAMDRFELAKQNCLKDYIVAVSSSLSDFSDEQIAFLAKAINEESAKRICGF